MSVNALETFKYTSLFSLQEPEDSHKLEQAPQGRETQREINVVGGIFWL